ncbi:DUF1631 family protein [Gilvimarinus agarilyticus]|uniref:DUF1631 family protein n=1 Tax=Gilvimarinus agarilyticus TaxID=679259 RepID=UPI00059F1DDE|nr:DUF1631 family protein [Gilvimarinus agarilyticus]
MQHDNRRDPSRLAQLLDDMSQWTGACTPLPASDLLPLLAWDKVSWESFRAKFPDADIQGLLAVWLLRAFQDNIDVDRALNDRVRQLQEVLLVRLTESAATLAWCLPEWCEQLDRLCFHWQGWYPASGRLGERFLARTDELLGVLESRPSAAALAALQEFNRRADRELDRAARLAHRIRESELGRQSVDEAHREVIAYLNNHLAGSSLPEPIYEFVINSIQPALQYYLLNNKREQWRTWADTLSNLTACLRPVKTTEQWQRFRQNAPVFVAQLSTAKPPHNCIFEHYHQFVTDVTVCVDRLSAGDIPDMIIAPPLFGLRSGAKAGESRTELRPRDLEPHGLKCGDWLAYRTEFDGVLRCQFLLQPPGSHELLFVNREGHRALIAPVGRIIDCLESGEARRLLPVQAYSTALNKASARLEYVHTELACERRVAEQLELQRLQRAERLREARERDRVRRKAASRAERIKALLEQKQRLKREQLVVERQREAARQALAEQRLHNALTEVAQLTVGSWAELKLESGQSVKCELVMVLQSTDKYVFHNHLGRPVVTLPRQRLAQMLMAGEAMFFQPALGFENRLERIVQGQRRPPSGADRA